MLNSYILIKKIFFSSIDSASLGTDRGCLINWDHKWDHKPLTVFLINFPHTTTQNDLLIWDIKKMFDLFPEN